MPDASRGACSRRYWKETLYDIATIVDERGDELSPDAPLKFKVYADAPRIELDRALPLRIGDVDLAFDGGSASSASSRNDHSLSTLLYYTYGLARFDTGPGVRWPYHRVVPSARAFYPVETYVAIPNGNAEAAAGIYHYDAAHHALVQLRDGDWSDVISAAIDARLAADALTFFATALIWKNAFVYRNYTYRLCTQEAGLVAGNIDLVSRGLGRRSAQVHVFDEDLIARLLCLASPDETPMLVVPVSADDALPLEPEQMRKSGVRPVSEVSWTYEGIDDVDLEQCDRALRMDAEARAEPRARTDTPADAVRRSRPDPERVVPVDPVAAIDVDLATALRRRNSGTGFFTPVGTPVARRWLEWVTTRALAQFDSDITGVVDIDAYALVNRVSDVECGIYRLDPEAPALELIQSGMDPALMRRPMLGPHTVNAASSNLSIYIVASHDDAAAAFGNRAYRIVNIACGVVAQRMCVMAGAVGMSARIHNGYHAVRTHELLGLAPSSGTTPVFQLFLGKMRTRTTEYRMPIVF